MCGIVGVFSLQGKCQVNEKIIYSMLDKIRYRGPDRENITGNEDFIFGFNRLSIIDPVTGMQPMTSLDNNITIVCNGEIFNYIELKNDLKKKGYSFVTESDIEVIIPLYQEYGLDFLDYLNGQFAIALYDRQKKRMILARDQLGICPLFYTIVEDKVIFASEIKAILSFPGVQASINLTSLDQILTFPSVISPETMFKNIKSLAAGQALLAVKNEDPKIIQYWDYNHVIEEQKRPISDEDYINELESTLIDAVKIRLRADVPIAAYLSGGLDSSLVLALMRAQLGKEADIKSFSIDFEDKHISEGKYQQLMSEHCNTNHHFSKFNHESLVERLENIVLHSESPLKETFNCASFGLSQLANKENIRVALAGQGADELFAGYVGYVFDAAVRSGHSLSEEEMKVQEKLWRDSSFVYEKHYSKYEDIKKQLYSKRIGEKFDTFNCLNYHVVNKDLLENKSRLMRRSIIDLKLRLSDHLLSDHGDRMAMANSVEVRYPFLDIRLVKLSMNMPDHLKLNNLTVKYALKQIAKKYLPGPVVNREKQGFAANGSPYLLKNAYEYINDLISYETIKRQDIFDADHIEKLKKQYMDPDFKIKVPFDNDLLMTVITFSIWQNTFNCKL